MWFDDELLCGDGFWVCVGYVCDVFLDVLCECVVWYVELVVCIVDCCCFVLY